MIAVRDASVKLELPHTGAAFILLQALDRLCSAQKEKKKHGWDRQLKYANDQF